MRFPVSCSFYKAMYNPTNVMSKKMFMSKKLKAKNKTYKNFFARFHASCILMMLIIIRFKSCKLRKKSFISRRIA